MLPEDDITNTLRQEIEQRGYWYRPIRCSICRSFIWFRPIAFKEPLEAPEPRHEWVLCPPCHEALLLELRRSSIRSAVRLRIAMGLVAAERSPHAYTLSTPKKEQQEFQREFAWGIGLLIFFALFHVVIFAILIAVPK